LQSDKNNRVKVTVTYKDKKRLIFCQRGQIPTINILVSKHEISNYDHDAKAMQ
jgi:hypothetical protein